MISPSERSCRFQFEEMERVSEVQLSQSQLSMYTSERLKNGVDSDRQVLAEVIKLTTPDQLPAFLKAFSTVTENA